MGATLTGQIVAETYEALLKVTDNGVITGTKKRITDGFGNDSPLLLSSTDVQIDGNLLLAGTISQYVRGDGSFATFTSGITTLTTTGSSGASTLIGSTLNVPNYTLAGLGGVPYTGATGNVDLGTHTLSAYNLIVNHTSGSGNAVSITKGGSGEALTITKTSGSGNAASITGGVTLISELHLTTDLADAYIASASTWNAKENALTFSSPLSRSTNTISIPAATTSVNGYLTSTDWTTFNGKIGGSGTTNYIPKFSASTTLANSQIFDDGTNVGIGTATPTSFGGTYKVLDVLGTNAMSITRSSGGVIGQVNAAGTDALYIGTRSNHNVNLTANNSNVLTLTTGGNVGIGTTSPSLTATNRTVLDINGTNNSLLAFSNGGTFKGYIYNNGTDIDYSASNSAFFGAGTNVVINTAGSERMRITSAGNVGIGTSSPATKTQFVGGGTTTSITNASTTVTSRFDLANSAISLGIGYVAADIPMLQGFNNGTNTATNVTINPFGGNVGIGTSSPTAKLDVVGGINYQNQFNRQTASYTLVLADASKIVEMNVAGANNLTVPLNSSVAFATGTEIQVLQYGAGQTTIVATSGVTLRSKSGQLKIANQYTGVTLVKVGTNEWYVIGNLSA